MITVLIVEDNKIIRESLQALINGSDGFNCPFVYGDCESAFADIERIKQADIVLLDIGLPGIDGIQGLKLMKKEAPSVDFIMLTVFDDNQRIFDALCAGACGYLIKKTQPAQLLEAIKDVYAGGSPMTPQIARKVVGILREKKEETEKNTGGILSSREREVLSGLADGLSYQEIAENLYISLDTVRQHIKSIYAKLHVHTQSGAVALAIRKGLI